MKAALPDSTARVSSRARSGSDVVQRFGRPLPSADTPQPVQKESCPPSGVHPGVAGVYPPPLPAGKHLVTEVRVTERQRPSALPLSPLDRLGDPPLHAVLLRALTPSVLTREPVVFARPAKAVRVPAPPRGRHSVDCLEGLREVRRLLVPDGPSDLRHREGWVTEEALRPPNARTCQLGAERRATCLGERAL